MVEADNEGRCRSKSIGKKLGCLFVHFSLQVRALSLLEGKFTEGMSTIHGFNPIQFEGFFVDILIRA